MKVTKKDFMETVFIFYLTLYNFSYFFLFYKEWPKTLVCFDKIIFRNEKPENTLKKFVISYRITN